MWVNSRDENYQGLGGLEDAVEACSPYDLYTGGFYEVYIGAAVLIRKLVKGGLSPSRSKKGAKP